MRQDEWIKVRLTLPDDEDVVSLADLIGVDDPDLIVGKLVRFWIWLSENTIDGNALSVTEKWIDRHVRCPGFAAALKTIHWLDEKDGRLCIPNFERHMSESAKKRALTSARVKRYRKTCNADVTPATLQKEGNFVTPSSSLSNRYSLDDPDLGVKEEGGAGGEPAALLTLTAAEAEAEGFLEQPGRGAAWEQDPRWVNAGQRPLIKYPLLFLSRAQLVDAFMLFRADGIPDCEFHRVFRKVNARLEHKAKLRESLTFLDPYSWLISWAKNDTLKELRDASALSREKVYSLKASQ